MRFIRRMKWLAVMRLHDSFRISLFLGLEKLKIALILGVKFNLLSILSISCCGPALAPVDFQIVGIRISLIKLNCFGFSDYLIGVAALHLIRWGFLRHKRKHHTGKRPKKEGSHAG